ncbi:MAG: gamma-glutamyl-gamma-aminobutyrate hydrolase family protein, partial [Oscillospiraceae bacterium]
MKKPVIAITGQLDPKVGLPIDISIYGATNHNCDHLVTHGAIPIVIPFIDKADVEQVIASVDGLLMTGGADVDPSLYNEEKQPYCASTQPLRDAADLALFAEALKQGKPILCICRGSQIANVYFGGSLYQDIATQVGTAINHSDYGKS